MRRLLGKLLFGVAFLYVGFCGALFLFQRSLIYFPQPSAIGELQSTTTMKLPTEAGRVLVSTRPNDGPKALIYLGGNAEDVSLNMDGFAAAFPNHAVYLLHYRGYGGSSGHPSEEALVRDALALFDQVQTAHPKVVVVGRSLGSGIAIHLASLRIVERLVLVTPYDSLAGIAEVQFPYAPVRWLLLDKFESWRYAPQVVAPTMIIAAELDEVVPRASTALPRTRFKNGIVTFAVIAGAGHNTISNDAEYLTLLKNGVAGQSF